MAKKTRNTPNSYVQYLKIALEAEEYAIQFFDFGVMSAGGKLRKKLLQMRRIGHELRKEIVIVRRQIKNERSIQSSMTTVHNRPSLS